MNTGYEPGMLDHRVTILNKVTSTGFGETTGYAPTCTVWASYTWNKGVKSLREGALDAYDTVVFRMLWNDMVNRDSRLFCDGRTYQIQSFNGDRHLNQIQITATEIIDGTCSANK